MNGLRFKKMIMNDDKTEFITFFPSDTNILVNIQKFVASLTVANL